MTTLVSPEQVEALRRIDTPTVCNAVEKLGIRPPTEGYTGHEVRCLLPQLGVMVGYAVTVRFGTSDPTAQHSQEPYWRMFELIEAAPQPSVIVAEEVGPNPGRGCVFGDGMATAASRLGAIGVVSNACVRDLAGIRGLAFHAFARGLVAAHGNFGMVSAGEPVEISGVTVYPGDLVHGDENGVCVFPAEVAADVIRLAHEVIAHEARLFSYLRHPDFTLHGLKGR
jgi:4-hydroxy-4-methyl-2-oxoglutarate aldolase